MRSRLQADLVEEVIAGLGLIRARGRRPGGEIRHAYPVTARRSTEMPLLAQIIPDRADGQVAAGQAKISLRDMLGAL